MSKGLFILLVGSSGSGKNTIINRIIKNNPEVKFLVSNTTREIRPHEVNGEIYNFMSKEEFELALKNNEMLEHDVTHKGYYGISKKTIEETLKNNEIVMKDISVKGAINCKDQLSKKVNIITVFLTESKSVLRKRLIDRGEKNHKLRLKIYGKEQAQMHIGDYIIKNTFIDNTIDKINTIIKYHKKFSYYPLLESADNIKIKKVEKYIKQLKKGEKLDPIEVVVMDDKVAIVKGVNRYLAELSTGKMVSKKFVSTDNIKGLDFNKNQEKWEEICKIYNSSK